MVIIMILTNNLHINGIDSRFKISWPIKNLFSRKETNKMSKNYIVITGGAGFIGSNMIKYLLKNKFKNNKFR